MQNVNLSFSRDTIKITQSQTVRQIKREEERRKEGRRRARNVSGRDRERAGVQESESKRASVSAWAREKEERGMKRNREGERGKGRKKKKWVSERQKAKIGERMRKQLSFGWTLKYGQVAKLVIWNSWNKHLLTPYEARWLFYFISCVRIVSKNL